MTSPAFETWVTAEDLLAWAGDDALLASFVPWLLAATPDERHAVAGSFNWDYGDAPLQWIIEQPDCDRATALMVFWLDQPELFLHSRLPIPEEDEGDLGDAIRRRWLAGFYTRAELAFDPAVDLDEMPDFVELEKLYGARVAEVMPPEMRMALPGRRAGDLGLIEGIPAELWDATGDGEEG